MSKLSSYGCKSGSSYGGSKPKHRHFGSSAKHRKNWDAHSLTGSAEGDLRARMQLRREAEDRLFIRR